MAGKSLDLFGKIRAAQKGLSVDSVECFDFGKFVYIVAGLVLKRHSSDRNLSCSLTHIDT